MLGPRDTLRLHPRKCPCEVEEGSDISPLVRRRCRRIQVPEKMWKSVTEGQECDCQIGIARIGGEGFSEIR